MVRLALVLLSAVSVPLVAEEKKSVHEETSVALKEAFHFSPRPEAATELPDQEVPAVVLERLTVVQSFERRQLERSIQASDERAKAEKFTLRNGGKLLGSDRTQLGIWPTGGGFFFLRFRW